MKRTLRIDLLILSLLLIISGRLSGQERLISKAAEEIQAGNFIKAEEQLESAKKKSSDNPFYLFTKYKFYASLSNVKFNIDTAHAYLLKSEESLKALNEDQLQKYCNEHQVCSKSFTELKNNVAEQAYHIYAQSNSIAVLNNYKEKYSAYPFINIADEKIDSILYQNAESENTIKAFEKYLSTTTKNIFLNAAKQRIQILAYDKATRINTVEAYRDYLNLYALPEQAVEVWGKIYEIAWDETLKLNTAKNYLEYNKDYPDSPYTLEALKLYKEKASLIPFLKTNGKYIYVDSELMEPVINQEFESAELFENNYALVKSRGKYGIINKSGELIVPFKYDDIINSQFIPNNWIVALKNEKNEKKWGVIDAQLKLIIPSNYAYIGFFNENNYFSTNYEEKFTSNYFFDQNGKVLFNKNCDNSDYLIPYSKLIVLDAYRTKKSVLFDFSGKELYAINGTWESLVNETGDVIYGKDGIFFDTKGNRKSNYGYVKPEEADEAAKGEGLFRVHDKNSNLYGYADYKGIQVIPIKFSEAMPFSEGLAAVVTTKNGVKYWSFIDKHGVEKINSENLRAYSYEKSDFGPSGYYVNSFQNGYSWAINYEIGPHYIIKSDGTMWPFDFEQSPSTGSIQETWGKVSQIRTGGSANPEPGSKYGLIDFYGKLILPTKYEAIENIDDSTCWIKDINGYWRVYDYMKGNFISEAFESNESNVSPQQVIVKGVGLFWLISNSGKPIYLNANFKPYSDIK